jgi:hypothetical protein
MTSFQTIYLTSHAIERYRERVRPGLSFDAAELELGRVAAYGEITAQAPAWHLRNCAREAPYYLVIAGVLLPLHPHRSEPDALVATTCLAQGCLSADARRYRNARKRRRSGRRTLPRPAFAQAPVG